MVLVVRLLLHYQKLKVKEYMHKILLIEDDLSVASTSHLDTYKAIICYMRLETRITEVILLDIMMPKLDGIETLKRLKANDQTKAIPVLMLTNAGVDVMRNEALGIGADRFIVKTEYDNATLIDVIKSYFK